MNIKKKLNEIIYTISRYTEIFLSLIILTVIVLLISPVVYEFVQHPLIEIKSHDFTTFLGNVLTLLIAVEFVKILAKHTAETLLEVLMFALARQMVVVHETMVDTLIGIVALGAIFAIRKYLLLKTPDKQKIYDKL